MSAGDLEQGRAAYAGRAWRSAFESLSRADEDGPLEVEDVERLAISAYLLGRDDVSAMFLERAHNLHADSGELLQAVRCAFWLGMTLLFKGEVGPGSGWLARAQRLLEKEGEDCAERGYLLLPLVFRHEAAGEWEAAADVARQAAEIGERFDDADLFAMATHARGHFLDQRRQLGVIRLRVDQRVCLHAL